MPTYRYRCGTCGDDVEIWQSITDDPLTTHDAVDGATCTGPLTKVLSPAGIVLKGSGFYKTDNRGGSRSGTKEATTGSKDSSGTTSSDSSSGSGSSGRDQGSGSSANGSGTKDSASGSKDSGSKSGAGASSPS